MFDIIGYWGVLTMTLMFPILIMMWLFSCFTNQRVKELGGAPISILSGLDKALEKGVVGIPVVCGTIISVVISACWVIHVKMMGRATDTFIGWHSGFAEVLSPVSGFVLAAFVAIVAYDAALKGYVRVTKLVNKLESKVE